jgi:hypothetical protein
MARIIPGSRRETKAGATITKRTSIARRSVGDLKHPRHSGLGVGASQVLVAGPSSTEDGRHRLPITLMNAKRRAIATIIQ